MAYYLKFTDSTGNASTNNDNLQIKGITGVLTSVQWTLKGDMPAQGVTRQLFDIRRLPDIGSDGGGTGWLIQPAGNTTSAETAGLSDFRVNDVAVSAVDLFNAVDGDVCKFTSNATPSGGCFSFGGRYTLNECSYGMGITQLVVVDGAGTHIIDMSTSGGTGSSLTSDTGSLTATLLNFPTDDSQWVSYGGANVAPTANAGADQTGISQGATVTLDATGSTDDVGISSYAWTQTVGTTVTLSSTTVAQPTFTAPASAETLTFEVTVTDAGALTSTDTVSITIASAGNQAPTANAGADQTGIVQGATVTLDATGSTDSDGTIASYLWTQTVGTTVTLSDTGAQQPTFTAPASAETLTFQVEVTDDGGLTHTDTVNIGVVALSTYNGAVAGPDASVIGGEVCTLDGRLSKNVAGNEPAQAFTWVQTAGNPVTLSYTSGGKSMAFFTAPVVTSPEFVTFSLVVNSSGQDSNPDFITIKITTAAELPTAIAGNDVASVSAGSAITLAGSATSPSSTIASYRWQQKSGAYVELSDQYSATPSFTAPAVSNRNVFAQDIRREQPTFSTASPHIPHAFSKLFDVTYSGAFRMRYQNAGASLDNESSYDAAGNIALSADRTKIYLVGFSGKNVQESLIPALSFGTTAATITNATNTQPYVKLLDQATAGALSRVDTINGLLPYNGGMIVTAEEFYDGTDNNVDNMMVLSDAGNLASGGLKGYLKLEGAAKAAGWMTPIPAEWQASFSSEYLVGWSTVHSRNGRYSNGPSLYTFNPQDAVDADINGTRVVPSTEFLSYGLPNPINEGANTLGGLAISAKWWGLTKAKYGFIIPNTNIYMALGSHQGIHDGMGYKIIRDDGFSSGGSDTFSASDKYSYFWLYDVNDILNASNSYDPQPFSYGKWNQPLSDGPKGLIIGAAFDNVINRLYLCCGLSGTVSSGKDPLIVTYDFAPKAQEITAIGTDLTDMVFELTVTDTEGLTSTDTVTVALDNGGADTTAPTITINPTQTTYNLTVGDSFSTPVGTSTDNVDTLQTVTPTGSVDMNTAGSYTLTYADSDAAGNVATPVVVTVNVSEVVTDTTPPVITVSGSASTTIAFGATVPTFTSSTDDGSTIDIGGDTVNNNLAGSYTITYNATDTAGNVATQVTRTVVVEAYVDTTPPVITLSPTQTSYYVLQDGTFNVPVGTSTDNEDVTQTITPTGTVDTATLGTYTLTYSDSDAAGNVATPVIVTVNVADIPLEDGNTQPSYPYELTTPVTLSATNPIAQAIVAGSVDVYLSSDNLTTVTNITTAGSGTSANITSNERSEQLGNYRLGFDYSTLTANQQASIDADPYQVFTKITDDPVGVNKLEFSVGTAGRDYPSITACIAANAQDLVTSDSMLIINVHPDGAGTTEDFTEFQSYTTSERNRIVIRGTVEKTAGDFGACAVVNISGSYGFVMRSKHVTIENLVINGSVTFNIFFSGVNCVLTNCLVRYNAGGDFSTTDLKYAKDTVLVSGFTSAAGQAELELGATPQLGCLYYTTVGLGGFDGDISTRSGNYVNTALINLNTPKIANNDYREPSALSIYNITNKPQNESSLTVTSLSDLNSAFVDPASNDFTVAKAYYDLNTSAFLGWNGTTVNGSFLGLLAGIPIESRVSYSQLYSYLVAQDYRGTINDVIKKWLTDEGFGGTVNDAFYAYLAALGYSGTLPDKISKWKNDE